MTRSQVLEAMHSGKPFIIRMADGRDYPVRTRDHIAISPKGTFVQVFDDEDNITTLPLLTMTALKYNAATESRGENGNS